VTRTTDASWIRTSLDESLARLQVDHVDLFMIHWPRNADDDRADDEGSRTTQSAPGKTPLRRLLETSRPGCSRTATRVAERERLGEAGLQPGQLQRRTCGGVEVEVLPQALAENIANHDLRRR